MDSLTQDGEPYATIKITKKGAPDKAVKMAVTGATVSYTHLKVTFNVCLTSLVVELASALTVTLVPSIEAERIPLSPE